MLLSVNTYSKIPISSISILLNNVLLCPKYISPDNSNVELVEL